MRYIRYQCDDDFLHFDGYLIKSEDGYYHICDPLCFQWLLQVNKLDWMEHFPLRVFPINRTYLYDLKENDLLESMLDKDWIFQFPVSEDDKPHFHLISNFFEHFLYLKSSTLLKRLENAIELVPPSLPESTLSHILRFILEHFEGDNELICIALSGKIVSKLIK